MAAYEIELVLKVGDKGQQPSVAIQQIRPRQFYKDSRLDKIGKKVNKLFHRLVLEEADGSWLTIEKIYDMRKKLEEVLELKADW